MSGPPELRLFMVEHDLRDLSPQHGPAPTCSARSPASRSPPGHTLPERQPAGGYVEPDLPLRHIPAPF